MREAAASGNGNAGGDASSDLSTTPSHTDPDETERELNAFITNVSKLELQEMLSTLSSLVSLSASCEAIRARIIPKNSVEGATRLKASIRDAQGTGFVWLRGFDACASGRVVASGRVWAGEDLGHVATALEIRGRSGGGKADLLVASWMRERLSSSATRAEAIRAAWQEELRVREAKRREEEEKKKEAERRLRKVEATHPSCILVSGEKIEVTQCGRGRRERPTINYNDLMDDHITAGDVEGEDDDEEEEEEEEDDDEDEEEDEFVASDGENTGKTGSRVGDDEDDEDEEEEDNSDADIDIDMEGPRTRRRLQRASSRKEGRETRGRKRARVASVDDERSLRRSNRRSGKQAIKEEEEDEDEDDDADGEEETGSKVVKRPTRKAASKREKEIKFEDVDDEDNDNKTEENENREEDDDDNAQVTDKEGRTCSEERNPGQKTKALDGLRSKRSSRRRSYKELSV